MSGADKSAKFKQLISRIIEKRVMVIKKERSV
jgi:hypothetical protein